MNKRICQECVVSAPLSGTKYDGRPTAVDQSGQYVQRAPAATVKAACTFADIDELVLLRIRHVLGQLPHAGAPLLALLAAALLPRVRRRRLLLDGCRELRCRDKHALNRQLPSEKRHARS